MIDPRVLSRAEESGTIRSGIPDRWQVGVLLWGVNIQVLKKELGK
jgi:hypothetical protein